MLHEESHDERSGHLSKPGPAGRTLTNILQKLNKVLQKKKKIFKNFTNIKYSS